MDDGKSIQVQDVYSHSNYSKIVVNNNGDIYYIANDVESLDDESFFYG